MSDSPEKARAGASKTGRVPRIEQPNTTRYEIPQPDTLPEFPDSDGTTGFMPVVNVEGKDSAKDADDDATRTQTGSDKTPTPR
jgi:hypothetical protein